MKYSYGDIPVTLHKIRSEGEYLWVARCPSRKVEVIRMDGYQALAVLINVIRVREEVKRQHVTRQAAT